MTIVMSDGFIRASLFLSLMFLVMRVSNAQSSEVEIIRERSFTGKALYGFMNGGSDLYYEYDFVELKALDVKYGSEEFSVEIYEMKSPEDAFGIYSIHAFGFHTRDTLFNYCNFSDYQAQAALGCYYLSVVYTSPVKGVNQKAVELIKVFSGAPDVENPHIPGIVLEKSDCVSGEVKMMKGELSVMNGASQLVPLIKGLTSFSLWRFHEANTNNDIALFITGNEKDLQTVIDRIPHSHLISREKGNILFYF